MILHNIKNYIFDGQAYCKKDFYFAHVNESDELKIYLIESVKSFCNDYKQLRSIAYNSEIHSHEIYKIPEDYEDDCLYSIDNAYFFDRIGLNNEEREIHAENIEKFRKYFVENKYLPKNRLQENNIVIHIRQIDKDDFEWGREDQKVGNAPEIKCFKERTGRLINKLKEKYPDYQIYIHSNGEIDFLDTKDFVFFGRETPILQMLSDFIHAKIFVCGQSSFSKICTFLGNHETIIVPDSNRHSVPQKSITISKFLKT